MNLAVSDFAWDNEQDIFYKKISTIGINQIEIIIPKIKPWNQINDNMLNNHLTYLNSFNLKPKTMQSLFFGADCNDITDTKKITDHLLRLIKISEILSINVLVFGSPILRKKVNNWEKSLKDIFLSIDSHLSKELEISIEPNSKIYGGEFFFSVDEIVSFIKKHNLKHVKTMIDTHNLIHENLDPISELEKHFDYINHIHISETNLSIILDNKFHRDFSKKIKEMGYNKTITYEVKPHMDLINSIELFKEIYF